MMTVLQHYQHTITVGDIQPDPIQQQVITQLQRVYDDYHAQKHAFFTWYCKPIKGIYLWGDVGIGKTYLINQLYDSLPCPKQRFHFHAFMTYIHTELARLQGTKNPIKHIVSALKPTTHVLFLDEFLVEEIGDAMVLSSLLDALLKYKICLITTANQAPQYLYQHGVQRERFLPAIATLEHCTDVIYMPSHTDYRRQGRQTHHSGNITTMLAQFETWMNTSYQHNTTAMILIQQRPIPIIARQQTMVWFEFKTLCGIPRSTSDYTHIAQHFDVVLLSHIEPIEADDINTITYFINLVDVLYDAGVTLKLASSVSLQAMYTHGPKTTEFKRTQSRLIAMNSFSCADLCTEKKS